MTEARLDGKPVYERIGTSINHFVSEDTVLSADFLRGIPFVQDIRSSIIPDSDEQSSISSLTRDFDAYTTAKEIVDLVEKGIYRDKKYKPASRWSYEDRTAAGFTKKDHEHYSNLVKRYVFLHLKRGIFCLYIFSL